MSARRDPLLDDRDPDRLFYATGAMLAADDFEAEQTYHRGRLARALAYLHGSGTVAGLRVIHEPRVDPETDPDVPEGREERLLVEPGVAIDSFGRLIEVPRAACIRLNRWYEQQEPSALVAAMHTVEIPADETPDPTDAGPLDGVVADLYARFVSCERGKTPAFASGAFDALDAVAPSRVRDEYGLDLLLRDEATPPEPLDTLPQLDPRAEGEGPGRLREAVLSSWREGTDDGGDTAIAALHAHAAGQTAAAVFVARLVIASEGTPPTGERPARPAGSRVAVLNRIRPFVYTAGALARWFAL